MKTKWLWTAVLAVLVLTQAAQAEEKAPRNPALHRRERRAQVNVWLSKGILGETNEGLLAVRGKAPSSAQEALKDENADRMNTFKEDSQKKSTPLAAQQKAFAAKRRKEIPAGSPIQQSDGSWSVKT